MKKKIAAYQWIELLLRGALVFSAFFFSILALFFYAARLYSWNDDWLLLAMLTGAALFSLAFSRRLYWVKNKKAKIWISSLGLTYLLVLFFLHSFYGELFIF